MPIPYPASPDLRMLCRLVSGQVAPASVDPAQWPNIVPTAVSNGLGPILAWRLNQSSTASISEQEQDALLTSARMAALRFAYLEQCRIQVAKALNENGVPAIWLKGIALAHTVYPQPIMRLMGDLDVLVPYEEREKALRVVQEQGLDFDPQQERPTLPERLTHHYHLVSRRDLPVRLELHYRLLGYAQSAISPEHLAWFWTQVQTVALDPPLSALTPEAHLLYLCAHAVLQHGAHSSGVRAYLDMHLLISKYSLNWSLVLEKAQDFGWSHAVSVALEITEVLFGTDVPAEILDALSEHESPHHLVGHANRMREEDPRIEAMRFLSSQLSTRQMLTQVTRAACPSRQYMRRRYAIPAHRPVWPYYLYRWWYIFTQVVKWLWERGRQRVTPRG